MGPSKRAKDGFSSSHGQSGGGRGGVPLQTFLDVFTAYRYVCGPDVIETQKPKELILRGENRLEAKTMGTSARRFLSRAHAVRSCAGDVLTSSHLIS